MRWAGICAFPLGLCSSLTFILCCMIALATSMYGISSCTIATIKFLSSYGSFEETFYLMERTGGYNTNQYRQQNIHTTSVGLFQWLRPSDGNRTFSYVSIHNFQDDGRNKEGDDSFYDDDRENEESGYLSDFYYERISNSDLFSAVTHGGDSTGNGRCVGYQQTMLRQISNSDDELFETARGFGVFTILFGIVVTAWGMLATCIDFNLFQITLLAASSFLTCLCAGLTLVINRSNLCLDLLANSSCSLDVGGFVMIASSTAWFASFMIAVSFVPVLMHKDDPDTPDAMLYEMAMREETRLRLLLQQCRRSSAATINSGGEGQMPQIMLISDEQRQQALAKAAALSVMKHHSQRKHSSHRQQGKGQAPGQHPTSPSRRRTEPDQRGNRDHFLPPSKPKGRIITMNEGDENDSGDYAERTRKNRRKKNNSIQEPPRCSSQPRARMSNADSETEMHDDDQAHGGGGSSATEARPAVRGQNSDFSRSDDSTRSRRRRTRRRQGLDHTQDQDQQQQHDHQEQTHSGYCRKEDVDEDDDSHDFRVGVCMRPISPDSTITMDSRGDIIQPPPVTVLTKLLQLQQQEDQLSSKMILQQQQQYSPPRPPLPPQPPRPAPTTKEQRQQQHQQQYVVSAGAFDKRPAPIVFIEPIQQRRRGSMSNNHDTTISSPPERSLQQQEVNGHSRYVPARSPSTPPSSLDRRPSVSQKASSSKFQQSSLPLSSSTPTVINDDNAQIVAMEIPPGERNFSRHAQSQPGPPLSIPISSAKQEETSSPVTSPKKRTRSSPVGGLGDDNYQDSGVNRSSEGSGSYHSEQAQRGYGRHEKQQQRSAQSKHNGFNVETTTIASSAGAAAMIGDIHHRHAPTKHPRDGSRRSRRTFTIKGQAAGTGCDDDVIIQPPRLRRVVTSGSASPRKQPSDDGGGRNRSARWNTLLPFTINEKRDSQWPLKSSLYVIDDVSSPNEMEVYIADKLENIEGIV